MVFVRIILFVLIFFCFSAFSQPIQCYTFRSVDYQFSFSEENQADQKSLVIALQKTSKNNKPKQSVTTTSELKILDAGGFLTSYIMAMGFFQYIQRKPSSLKKVQSNMIDFIKMYLINFHQKIQSLHQSLSQNLKPKDLQNMESIIRETAIVLQILNHSKLDIRLFSNHLDKIRNFIHLARVSSLDDVKGGMKAFLPLQILIKKDQKWEKQDLLTELQVLPPLSILGQRFEPFLCNREAVSIRAVVAVPRSFLK